MVAVLLPINLRPALSAGRRKLTRAGKARFSNEGTLSLPIKTVAGDFLAHYSDEGLTGLNFPNSDRKAAQEAERIPPEIRAWHCATELALKSILAGKEPGAFPPLAPAGTVFQKSVWRALRHIALGKTKSYGEIAAVIGRPLAVRAVGGACGANPIPVLVPCHRVLAANKKIGGFSGGLDWKRRLLEVEGVQV
jgi:O-6-methylguanine DNA methyltransferase